MSAPWLSNITVQKFVYHMDVGGGLLWARRIFFGLLLLLLPALYTFTQFRGLDNAAAMEQGQLARNLAERHGFVTDCVRPLSLSLVAGHAPGGAPRLERHPDLSNAPVYPLLLAPGFLIPALRDAVPPVGGWFLPELWMVFVNHLFVFLSAWMLFSLARRLFERRVAALALIVYFASNTVWRDSLACGGLPVAMFFTLAAVRLALTAAAEDATSRRALAAALGAGALAALAFLTRYGAGVLLPVLAGWLWLAPREDRRRQAFLFAGVFLLLAAPWLARNTLLSGNPFGLALYLPLQNTELADGNVLRALAPALPAWDVLHAVQVRWMRAAAGFYDGNLRNLGDGFFGALFAAALLFNFARRESNAFKWPVAAGLALVLVAGGFFGPDTFRLVNLFAPLAMIYGCAFLFLLLDRMETPFNITRALAAGVAVLLAAVPLIFALLPPRAALPYPPYYPPFIAHVCAGLRPAEWICTDMPWATAWYGRRHSLLLPRNLDDFYEIHYRVQRQSGLYFTPLTRNKPYIADLRNGADATWFPIMEGLAPDDFPLREYYAINAAEQVFLTDFKRWNR